MDNSAFEAAITAFGMTAQTMGGRMTLLKAAELLRLQGMHAASDILMQNADKLTKQEAS